MKKLGIKKAITSKVAKKGLKEVESSKEDLSDTNAEGGLEDLMQVVQRPRKGK